MINDDNNDDDNSIIIICIIIFIAVNLLVFIIFNIPFLLILSSFCTISFVIIKYIYSPWLVVIILSKESE